MIDERDLLLQSLPPADADWPTFESRFPGKTADCALTAELIALAEDQAPPEVQQRVRPHLAACRYCRTWFEAYRKGFSTSEPGTEQEDTGILLGDFATDPAGNQAEPIAHPNPPPAPPLWREGGAEGVSSVILTGFHTLVLAGRIQEALRLLQPYLPDVLAAVDLDPGLADRLRQFLAERLADESRQGSSSLPEWLQSFAREKLHRDLPRRPLPEEWKPIVGRCALRCVHVAGDEPEPVRQFLAAALERGVQSISGLNRFREKEEAYRKAISGNDLHRLIHRVSKEQNRVARLFGLP